MKAKLSYSNKQRRQILALCGRDSAMARRVMSKIPPNVFLKAFKYHRKRLVDDPESGLTSTFLFQCKSRETRIRTKVVTLETRIICVAGSPDFENKTFADLQKGRL
jgi:hypothetical protein